MKNLLKIVIISGFFALMSPPAGASDDGGLADAGGAAADAGDTGSSTDGTAADAGDTDGSGDGTIADAGDTTTQPATGEEGGPCYGNDTCNTGLDCVGDICVAASSDDGGVEDSAADAGETATAGDGGTATAGDGGTSTTTDNRSITILSPSEGDTVEGPLFEVRFEVTGCEVHGPSDGPGGCHIHKILNGSNYQDPLEGGGTGHYNANPMQVRIHTAGTHDFGLVLVSNDGSDAPFDPEIGDSITIIVDVDEIPPEEEDDDDDDDDDGDDDDDDDDGDDKGSADTDSEDAGGCGCDVSNQDARALPLWLALCGGLLFLRRRRS